MELKVAGPVCKKRVASSVRLASTLIPDPLFGTKRTRLKKQILKTRQDVAFLSPPKSLKTGPCDGRKRVGGLQL